MRKRFRDVFHHPDALMFHPLRPRFDEVRHRAVEIGCRFDEPVGARTQAGADRMNKTKGIFRHRQREGERPRLQSDRETETGSKGMLGTRKSAHEAAFPLRDDTAEGNRVLACAVRKSEFKFRAHRTDLCLWIELLILVLLQNAAFPLRDHAAEGNRVFTRAVDRTEFEFRAHRSYPLPLDRITSARSSGERQLRPSCR